ncbi:hypothetical protein CH293_02970 [Rhodococcus sp. 14-2470-1b]|uniref:hypothetical protein n=1 Tax=Rhodococcus sp. 14-2470-1b TaxID=2023149 RepID=UPI000B9C38A7|nr:hypothetical protein [Rhodococcus sp. 14-2470-1b]OZF57688.1 hypothetical protein CH293_02970 [Rhodococcus sp. 14-2470-1b]
MDLDDDTMVVWTETPQRRAWWASVLGLDPVNDTPATSAETIEPVARPRGRNASRLGGLDAA